MVTVDTGILTGFIGDESMWLMDVMVEMKEGKYTICKTSEPKIEPSLYVRLNESTFIKDGESLGLGVESLRVYRNGTKDKGSFVILDDRIKENAAYRVNYFDSERIKGVIIFRCIGGVHEDSYRVYIDSIGTIGEGRVKSLYTTDEMRNIMMEDIKMDILNEVKSISSILGNIYGKGMLVN